MPDLDEQGNPIPGTEGEGEGQKPEVPDWRADIDEIREQQRNTAGQMMGILGELAQMTRAQVQRPAAPEQPTQQQSVDKAELWKSAMQVPEAIPELIQQQIQDTLRKELGGFRKNMEEDWGRKAAGDAIQGMIQEHYSEEIRDQSSPILSVTPQMRELVAPLIRPELIGTPLHDKLAFAIAGFSKPEAITRRYSAFSEAKEKERQRQIADMSRMAAAGIKQNLGQEEPTLTEEDEVRAAKFGIDLSKPEERKWLLEQKKNIRMRVYGSSDIQED